MKHLLAWILLPLAGALALYALSPDRTITYTDVIVPAARIIEREPPIEVRFRDRIVYRYVEYEQRAVAPGGALEQAQAFCRPQVLMHTQTDTVFQVDTLVLMRSAVHRPGWFISKDDLLVTTVSSVGDLEARDYRVRPGFSAVAAGNDVLVRYPRMALPRELVEILAVLGVGFGIGKAF